ncbi:Two-component system sensor histidine kinase/response regulator [Streptomyces albidoflavus]|uniref:PAS domain-containing protein n=1 Tax=Streptomyces TaxID=1883 RepID=UPI0002C69060|nr:PAS domain-containing protein [Streptomyces albidoflavus]AGI89249.1 Two-component system sensor histidine kinase/response regulator [Streptomyces albidoflavus]QLP93062.1 Two-component system sensor histidine kinase/response regulator [Streptomyces albidoflavus]WAE11461.1 Two-component system sensor histidine kinase/response regulator [Streptomyces albidoflavus]WAE17102.1 Two-component system sensor histidine kinase/response regulator [Streptomyces albidoflavus]
MSSRPSRGAARLAAILDALPDALVLVNCNGTVVNANTIALERLEAPGTALVGRGLLDLLPEFDSRLIPGSMRRPDTIDEQGRTRPTRMTARRTDGSEFPVEVTSASLAEGRESGWGAPSQFGTGAADQRYTGDELLMIVVRDLSGTVDTEAELARSQRQTEMILRAAAEGVVGTDTDGRVVLVNPAAAQILGFRAGDLGGREFHTLVLHSRADGEPFPYAESPLADTLRSGRKHRVRGQVLWAKDGSPVPVDLTTAPVRDGDQLVGAVVTFTDRRAHEALVAEHAEEQAAAEKRYEELAEREQRRYEELETSSAEKYETLDRTSRERYEELERASTAKYQELERTSRERYETLERESAERYEALAEREKERYAALGEREKDRYEALAARHDQLVAVLSESLRGPLDHLRSELGSLAADPAGQLWPEANQILHHLSAGYARMTTLVDNVLGYQRLDAGQDSLDRKKVLLDEVIAAGVEGAVELIGPGRAQFAVHAPSIEAEIDPHRFATALAHLIADVAGIDATGNARQTPQAMAGGYIDSTVVVAAALRGNAVRIEVRGPFAGGDPVHEPLVRGIVRAHGGVLQTHAMAGMSGSAYVLDIPLGEGAGAVQAPPQAELPAGGTTAQAPEGAGPDTEPNRPHGRRRRRAAPRSSVDSFLGTSSDGTPAAPEPAPAAAPTGRRRGRRAADETPVKAVLAGQDGGETPAAGSAVALPAPTGAAEGGTGRRRRRAAAPQDGNAPTSEGAVTTAAEHAAGTAASASALGGTVPPQGVPPAGLRAAQPALPPAGSTGPGAAVVIAPGVRPGLSAAVPRPAQAPDDQQGRAAQRPAPSAMPALPPAGAPAPARPTPPGMPDTPAAPAAPAPAVGTPGETVQALPSGQPHAAPVPGQVAPAPVPPQFGQPAGPTAASTGTAVPAQPGVQNPATAPAPAPGPAPVPPVTAAPGVPVPPAPAAPGTAASPATPPPAAAVPAAPTEAQVPAANPAGSQAPVPPGFPAGTAQPVQPGQPAPQPPAAGPLTPPFAVGQALQAPVPGSPVPPAAPATEQAAPAPGAAPAPDPTAVRPQHPLAPPQLPAASQGGPASSMPLPPATGTPTAPGAPGTPPAPVGQQTPPAGLPAQQPVAQPGVPGQQPAGSPVQVPPGAAYPAAPVAQQPQPAQALPGQQGAGPRRARRALADGPGQVPGEVAETGPGLALPSAEDAHGPAGHPALDHTPPQAHPLPTASAPLPEATPAGGTPVSPPAADGWAAPTAATGSVPLPEAAPPVEGQEPAAGPQTGNVPGLQAGPEAVSRETSPVAPTGGEAPVSHETSDEAPVAPVSRETSAEDPAEPVSRETSAATPAPAPQPQRVAQPLPAESAEQQAASAQSRAFSVRTLGQGVPFAAPGRPAEPQRRPLNNPAQPPQNPPPPAPAGRRRKLGTPPAAEEAATPPAPQQAAPPAPPQQATPAASTPVPAPAPAPEADGYPAQGRSYAIGAPDEGAEGPEPLDGPNGAVEVANQPQPQPQDAELPPEPLDNPRRLLVWPAPDVSTQQALSDRGYRPVIVHSREEVDAQIAAFPAALFVDPLTGPITRTALQSLRQAAVAAEVPVLVTAGLGQATREAAYGADPAVLLKALAARDSEQHPSRVLLIEEREEIALALTAALERRGMQVARATTDTDAVNLATQMHPNLVVMDLMQVRRRRAGVVDWLRANGRLNHTPLVVYTAAGIDPSELPRLASGETVLFLAERSTTDDVQARIVDLLAKIGTN